MELINEAEIRDTWSPIIESATGNDDIDWEDLNDVLNQAYEWNINFDGENNDKSDWNFKFESVDFRKIKQQWLNENL